ncbi:uncharacterized protein LOC130736293 [Lotus japonicus]|uniref:uncharacterized protein LOC130736293 n=1 Tax=Lotus japonicus TaxID=34305 RepID=UPI0025857C88|nr:uncharacterized protein LOC130736293 [Lotus japonicus]
MVTTKNGDQKDHYSAKPPVFDGKKFDYWKDRIESFFLGFDADFWVLVVDGYTRPVDEDGVKIPREKMNGDQKKKYKDHHRARTILLNAISYEEYKKINDRESAKSIFDSLRMTHEGNEEVKETKALAFVKKYEAFKMEPGESVAAMFSRFQMLIVGIRVLDKSYTTADHAKKIIRSLLEKWMPLVNALKLSKNLNKISLEDLVSILRSHEIDRAEHLPQMKQKSIALKSRPEKAKALQAEEESEESTEYSDEDELSLVSRRLYRIWKHRQNKYKGSTKAKGRQESSTGQRKSSGKEITCFECKESGHYKNECPKLKRENKPKKNFKAKKGLMVSFDASRSEEEDSDDEVVEALMAVTKDKEI